MDKKIYIGNKELCMTLVNVIVIKMFFTFGRNMIISSGTGAWIQLILVSLVGAAFFLVQLYLLKPYATKSIIKVSEEIGKKPLKIIVGIILIVAFLSNTAQYLRILPESVKSVLLPLTPIHYIIYMLAFVIGLGAWLGIFSIARIHALLIPLSAVVLSVFLILLLPHLDFTNLTPVLGTGTQNIIMHAPESLGFFSDVAILYVLAPYCKSYNQIKKCCYKSLIIGFLVSLLLLVVYTLSFSYPTSTEFVFPIYETARLIKIGDFFQRMEAIFEFVWSICMMLYIAAFLFAIIEIWGDIFDLDNKKVLIFPFVLIMTALSFWPSSVVSLVELGKIVSYVYVPVTFLLPVVIFGIYKIKKVGRRDSV